MKQNCRMDRTSEIDQSDMSSPVLLNSLNFPPLKSALRPETLIMPPHSKFDETKFGSARSLPKKRPMNYEEEQILNEDSLSQNSENADSVDFQSTSPLKKSRKFAYRDPPPVLQSLDSDSFKALFESPTLADSQNSESGLWINSRASCSETLGSLGEDIIQKYSTTTLNSIKVFEIADSSTSETSSSLLAPDSGQNYPTSKTDELTPFMNTVNQNKVREVCSISASGFVSSKENESNKSKNQMKSSIAQEDKPKLKTDNPYLDDSDEDDGEEENDELSASELFEGEPMKYQKCRKHENHSKFHPIPNLQVRDVPEEIRHEDSVTFLSCLSQLVVQITVHSTSKSRGPDDMYSSYIGTDKKRFGSGFIASVDEVITQHRCKREGCPCAVSLEDFSSSFEDSGSMASPSFNRSGSSASTSFNRSASNISTASSSSSSSGGRGLKHFFYGGVRIHTNKHVIFDRSEAENAYIQFFYNTPEGKEVVHGHVAAISGVNNSQDHVVLHVMSHDKSVFTTLDLCLHDAKTCYKQMLKSTEKIQPIPAHKHSWVAIISHPHGLTKTITFGRVVDEIKQITRIIKYYDAPTCPGSSGGLVITPSLLRLQWPGAVHSCTDTKTGYNITFDSRFPDLDQKEMRRIHKTVLSQKYSYPESIFKL